MPELLQAQPRVEAELTQPFAVARRHENVDGNDRRTPLPYPSTSRHAGRRSDRVGNHLVRIVVKLFEMRPGRPLIPLPKVVLISPTHAMGGRAHVKEGMEPGG
jgi:hypothetical protein